MTRKQVASHGATWLSAFALGWVLQPDPPPAQVIHAPPQTMVEYAALPAPHPTPASDLVVTDEPGKPFMIVEREAIPQPTDCLVMRWVE